MLVSCLHCDEPITGPVEWIPLVTARGAGMRARHPECAMRMVIGGLNHLQGRCTCCGGTEPPDPPGMTHREAALAAADYWRSLCPNDRLIEDQSGVVASLSQSDRDHVEAFIRRSAARCDGERENS